MMVPDGGTGHLYKYVAVLGTFLLITSIYSISVSLQSHDAVLRETVEKFIVSKDLAEDQRQFWLEYLQSQKRNTVFAFGVLLSTALVGTAMMVTGMIFWYRRVQTFEDQRRGLENQQLGQQLEAAAGTKRLVT